MELASLLRPLGIVAGPAALVALVLLVVGMATEDEAALLTSPLVTASLGLLLVAMLGIGAAAVAALARLRDAGRPVPGVALAVIGTVLVAGGGWAGLFVLPALAAEAPEVLERGLQSVVVGYIASYFVFAVGWLWTGIALIRARLVPTWLGVLVAVGGLVAFVPGPGAFRLVLVSVAATLLARRLAVREPIRTPEPAAA